MKSDPTTPAHNRRNMRRSLLVRGMWVAGAVLLRVSFVQAQTPPDTPPREGRTRRGAGGSERRGERGGGRGGGRLPATEFRTEVPAHPVDLILGRPTGSAVTVSVLAYEELEGSIAYGTQPGAYTSQTSNRKFSQGEPVELLLSSLRPDTRYYYRLRSRTAGVSDFRNSPEYTFVTARRPGAPFTFTVQADSHLDAGSDPEVYKKSLANALAAKPDFHVDLGDTFMTDKYADYRLSAAQYLAQRYYFGLIGHSAALFLTLGNHDGEQLSKGGRGPDSMAMWSNTMRKRYYPNPLPNDFYTGNRTPDPEAGLLENYYAWTWGDAQFVVLDPFWYSERPRGRGDAGANWSRTLGTEQYRWLQQTLEASKARFKFVFIHHLVGGETPEGRGGAEASHFFEWGGKDLNGTPTFPQHRPGWPAPIHDLLVKHGVSIVFHGHDHLYARQERDGLVYQEVPQPGHTQFDNPRSAGEYGYTSGVLQGSSGILRVTVSPDRALIEYVRAYPAGAENGERRTGAVTDRYIVAKR